LDLVIEHTFYRNGIPLNFPDVKRKKTVPALRFSRGGRGDWRRRSRKTGSWLKAG